MGGLEAVMTGIQDQFKSLFSQSRHSREIFTGIVCLSAFIFALPNVTSVRPVHYIQFNSIQYFIFQALYVITINVIFITIINYHV